MTDHADLIFRLSVKSDPESRDAHTAIKELVAERDNVIALLRETRDRLDEPWKFSVWEMRGLVARIDAVLADKEGTP